MKDKFKIGIDYGGTKIEAVLSTGATQIILPPHRRPLYGFYKDNDLKKMHYCGKS